MENKSNERNAGRKLGSKNNLNQEFKKKLTPKVLDNLVRSLRNINTLDDEKKVALLLKILPYVLPKGNLTNEESEIQNIMIEKTLPFFKKFNFYLNQVPTEKKAQVLVSILKNVNPTPSQQSKILDNIK